MGFYYTFIEDYNDPLYYDYPIFACYYRNGQRVNLEESEWQVGEATGVFIEWYYFLKILAQAPPSSGVFCL